MNIFEIALSIILPALAVLLAVIHFRGNAPRKMDLPGKSPEVVRKAFRRHTQALAELEALKKTHRDARIQKVIDGWIVKAEK